jgi:hypothetical protein
MGHDRISLGWVVFCEIVGHRIEKSASHFGRKKEVCGLSRQIGQSRLRRKSVCHGERS